jgi:hypothetical protein
MMKIYTITSISDFTSSLVDIITDYKSTQPWWRGQADEDWNLLPSIYRNDYTNKKEVNMAVRFRNMAKVRYENCPNNKDFSSWLFLMQHYRLPTRLLDWTMSPLIALYFAVEAPEYDELDGAVWALNPEGLNIQQRGNIKICSADHKDIQKLSLEAFRVNETDPDKSILPVLSDQIDARHMLQQATFTIHGDSTLINNEQDPPSYLAKMIIPSEKKEEMRQTLNVFGISRATIFPDLENLAAYLSSLDFS